MDRIRFGLWFGLLASVWISYTTWVTENQPDPAEAPATAPTADAPGGSLPELPAGAGDVPDVPDPDGAAPAQPGQPGQTTAAAPERFVRVETDVLDLVIDLAGGDIVRADLREYPVAKDQPDVPVRLLDFAPASRWVFQTGYVAPAGVAAPNHEQPFEAAADSYRLAEGADSLVVRLEWQDQNGLAAEKIYTFTRGAYSIDLDLLLRNGSGAEWRGNPYAQMTRLHAPLDRSFLNVDSYSFTGPVVYDGDEAQKPDFEDLQRAEIRHEDVVGGWLASIQHHFLAAVVPPPADPIDLRVRATGQSYHLTALGPTQAVAPGSEQSYAFGLFVGPKLQDQLEAAAPGRELELTVDYGMLTVLSQPLFWVLDLIHGWVGNWGWSIIITTILIKLVFYKLTATSGRSMAKMRKLAPRMKALQEKHKEDRQALSAAMMDLYKKEKVNPAAGCLPILVQMPFFFAFYWVLVESVEMRQAPFMLWINDLSVRDPFFILPLLMCGAMWFQMRLNPAPPDPVQARVMQIMPFIFAAMFAFFPAGLVLYWLTNTVISIAQQWRINQLVAREA